MRKDLLALFPEISLITGAVATLLVGSFTPRERQWRARAVAVLFTLAALVGAAVAFATETPRLVYDYNFAVDTATHAARLVVCASLLVVFATAHPTVARRGREAEFYVLALLVGVGTLGMAGASDLLVLEIALLLASLPVSGLIGWGRGPAATEATMKFFLLGALSSVTMVAGIAILFGATGTTAYRLLDQAVAGAPRAAVAAGIVALLAGLLFKAAAVPMHFWLPDAAEGASVPAAAFVSTVPKVGALVGLYRLFAGPLAAAPVDWELLVGVLAALSMTVGNLAALRQDSPRRLLGYSTISQSGYLLMAVAGAGSDLSLRALLFYLAAYSAANLAAFAVVAALPGARRLADYAGLGARRPALAITLGLALLALVGTPPTAIFFGKLTVFGAAGDAGSGWLVVVAALNTVVSLFYYLRWLAPAFLGTPLPGAEGALVPAGRAAPGAAYAAGAMVLALGLASGAALALFAGRMAPL